MSASRMIATLMLLQQRGTVTAAEVAQELEVSERTARRTLDALSVAGIPVYSRAGRGGGWSLLGGARTDLTGLTASEARALFTVAGPGATASPELRDALRKLVSALPESFRRDAEAAADAIVIDPARWGRRVEVAEARSLGALRTAIIDTTELELTYRDRRGSDSRRLIEPLGLVDKSGVWYVVADTPQGRRMFRADRVVSVTPTGRRFDRPDDFDLDASWREQTEAFEASWAGLDVEARVDREMVGLLGYALDGGVERLGDVGDDGRVPVRLNVRDIGEAVGRLAGFAGRLVVTAPDDVCAALSEAGRLLVRDYGEAS